MNTVVAEHVLASNQTIQILQGDITSETVDAVVNAANEHLQHGGGVAWVISRKGGPTIQQESDAWVQQHGPVPHAHPAWTAGGQLPAKYVIHAVGPVWGSGDEEQKLTDAVFGSLRVADSLNCASVALPAISTGIYGFPKERAAKVMLTGIEDYFDSQRSGILLVKLVLFDQETVDIFLNAWRDRWGSSA